MNNKLFIFSKIYFKFFRHLEVIFLSFEKKLFKICNFASGLFIKRLFFLKISFRFREFMSSIFNFLISSSYQQDRESKWFNELAKIFKKKAKIFYNHCYSLHLSSISPEIYSGIKKNTTKHYFFCSHNLFFNCIRSKKNKLYNLLSFIFICPACKKIIKMVESNQFLDLMVFFKRNFFSVNSKLITSLSSFLVCGFCRETTKILKIVLLSPKNDLIVDSLFILDGDLKNEFLSCLKADYFLDKKSIPEKFFMFNNMPLRNLPVQKNKVLIFKYYYLILDYHLFVQNRVVNWLRNFGKFYFENTKTQKKKKKLYPVFVNFSIKILKFKLIELLKFKNFNENLLKEIKF